MKGGWWTGNQKFNNIDWYESICEEEDETSRSHFDTIIGQYNKKTTQQSTNQIVIN